MAGEPSWKKHERRAAILIRGARHWANSGQALDAESSSFRRARDSAALCLQPLSPAGVTGSRGALVARSLLSPLPLAALALLVDNPYFSEPPRAWLLILQLPLRIRPMRWVA